MGYGCQTAKPKDIYRESNTDFMHIRESLLCLHEFIYLLIRAAGQKMLKIEILGNYMVDMRVTINNFFFF